MSEQDHSSPEIRLLEFLEFLIVDLARTHPNVTQGTVSDWLARVVVGSRKVSR
jgi:hypothetical protein